MFGTLLSNKEKQTLCFGDRTFGNFETIYLKDQVIVVKCKELSTNKDYAIKVVRNKDHDWIFENYSKTEKDIIQSSSYYCCDQLSELICADICNNYFNSHILTYEVAKFEGNEAVFLSLYRGINLNTFKNQEKRLNMYVILEILAQTMFALIPLHKDRIVHRDIKPTNILILESNGIEAQFRYLITLVDFGVSKHVHPDNSDGSTIYQRGVDIAGTDGFIAPECFSEILSTKNDVWSTGSTLLRLLFPHITLVDFGVSKHVHPDNSDGSTIYQRGVDIAGTDGFIAPECFSEILSTKNDVWSTGSTLLRLLFPHDEEKLFNLSEKEKLKKAEELVGCVDGLFQRYWDEYHFDQSPGGWGLIQQIIKGMLNNNLHERYSCEDVLDLIFRKITSFGNLLQNFRNLNHVFCRNRDVILEAVTKDSSLFEIIEEPFKSDFEIIILAIRENAFALTFVDDNDVKNDKGFIRLLLVINGACLRFVPDEFKSDKDTVLLAVENYGLALEFAVDTLKRDREVVLKALNQNGNALRYASDGLKQDRQIVLRAVQKSGFALKYADQCFHNDVEIATQAVKQNKRAIMFVTDETLRSELEQVSEIPLNQATLMQNVKERMKTPLLSCSKEDQTMKMVLCNDKEQMIHHLRRYPQAIPYQDECIRKDTALLLKVIEWNANAFLFIDESLRLDEDFILKATNSNYLVLNHIKNHQ